MLVQHTCEQARHPNCKWAVLPYLTFAIDLGGTEATTMPGSEATMGAKAVVWAYKEEDISATQSHGGMPTLLVHTCIA